MKKLKFTLILQARLKSTRLFQKVIKKLDKYEIVLFLQKRLLTLKDFIDYFIVAVPYSEEQIFINYLENGFILESGEEENVLARFAKIFTDYQSDYLIRVTSDNPFTSLSVLKNNIKILNRLSFLNQRLPDYFVRTNLPLGVQTEIIKNEAFWDDYKNANKKYHFEHVTPYIYENENKFNILRKPFNRYSSILNLRLTIDTEKDYIVAQNIVNSYINKHKPAYLIDLPEIEKIYLKNKTLLEFNKDIIQKNYKE